MLKNNLFSPNPTVISGFLPEVHSYGFNGKEKENEHTSGNYDFGARILDTRLGRWLTRDSHASSYPAISPYVFSLNSPNLFRDSDGNDAVVTIQKNANGGGVITIAAIVYITGENASAEKAQKLTNKADEVYRDQTVEVDGQSWTIKVDVVFAFEPDETKIKLDMSEKNRLDMLDKPENYTKGEDFLNHVVGGKIPQKDGSFKVMNGVDGQIMKYDNEDDENMAVLHEVLHFLGLSDRYKIDDNGTPEDLSDDQRIPNKGWSKDIMSGTALELSKEHYQNWAKSILKSEVFDKRKNIMCYRADVDSNGNPLESSSTDASTKEIKTEPTQLEDSKNKNESKDKK